MSEKITDQETEDREWLEKYGIRYHRGMKHETCPHCGSTNVGVEDPPYEPEAECRFQMICEDCDKKYQAVYTFSFCVTIEV